MIISLGSWCGCRYQINLIFNDIPSGVFDWCFVKSIKQLAHVFKNNFTDFFRIEDLSFFPNYVIFHKINNFVWNHIYESNPNLIKDSEILTKNKFINDYPHMFSKINHTLRPLLQSKEEKTLYVLTNNSLLDYNFENLIFLRNAIFEFRGNNNFLILVFVYSDDDVYENIENVKCVKSIMHGSTYKDDDSDIWKQNLNMDWEV